MAHLGSLGLFHLCFPFDNGLHPGHDFYLRRMTPGKDVAFIRKTLADIKLLRSERNYSEADRLRDVLASQGVTVSYRGDGEIMRWGNGTRHQYFNLLRTRWVPTEKGTFFIIRILGWRLKLWRKGRKNREVKHGNYSR